MSVEKFVDLGFNKNMKKEFFEIMSKVAKDAVSSEQIGNETEYYDEDGIVILSVEMFEDSDDPRYVSYSFNTVFSPETFIIKEKKETLSLV